MASLKHSRERLLLKLARLEVLETIAYLMPVIVCLPLTFTNDFPAHITSTTGPGGRKCECPLLPLAGDKRSPFIQLAENGNNPIIGPSIYQCIRQLRFRGFAVGTRDTFTIAHTHTLASKWHDKINFLFQRFVGALGFIQLCTSSATIFGYFYSINKIAGPNGVGTSPSSIRERNPPRSDRFLKPQG